MLLTCHLSSYLSVVLSLSANLVFFSVLNFFVTSLFVQFPMHLSLPVLLSFTGMLSGIPRVLMIYA